MSKIVNCAQRQGQVSMPAAALCFQLVLVFEATFSVFEFEVGKF